MRKLILVLLLFFVFNCGALEFEEIDGYDIPSICQNLPSNVSPTNLSAACLAAQVAAQAWPVLLPAANQLCTILEGITAKVEVAQLKINKIHEECDVEMAKLENDLLSGVNSYHSIGTNYRDLFKKMANIQREEDLEYESLHRNNGFLGLSLEELENINTNEDEPDSAVKKSQKRYLKKIAGADYLGNWQFLDYINTFLIDGLQKQIKESKSLKASLDLSARISAELAFQQSIQSQLLGHLLDLKSSENIKDMANDKWVYDFLKIK